MKRLFALMLALFAFAASEKLGAAPASAQTYAPSYAIPVYERWQADWDRSVYDRGHVILGVVAGFRPYRLEIRRQSGDVQRVDLKNGTVILPTGTTPMPGERIAMVGYYSNGTFIVNRLVIHP